MKPATAPRGEPLATRLLALDTRTGRLAHARIRDLPRLLRAGDLLVVNDAATLPASLPGRGPGQEALELRLAGPAEDGRWTAVLLGAGDWRARTEDRPAPVALREGDVVTIAGELRARVVRVRPESPRLLELAFALEGDALWRALYRHGRPVQYSYLERPLALQDVQTSYAGRPWAAEAPSAGRPLGFALMAALRAAGVRTAAVTHAAGLSATGDAALDALLPLPERFDVPAETAAAVRRARALGGRVVAVGTTVVRALESAAFPDGSIEARQGITDLVVGPDYRLRVVDGILTGMHEPGSSHFALLSAFAPASRLESGFRAAESEGYLAHEFGDAMLLLASAAAEPPAISPTVSKA
jgi:S-adenosylmethionine:tRNA ribosyltransferase-isomerase